MAQRNAKHRRSLPTPDVQVPSFKLYQTNPAAAAARSTHPIANKIHSPSSVHFQAKGSTLSADFVSAKPSKKLVQVAEKQRRKTEEEPCNLNDKEMAVRRSSVSSLMASGGMGRRSFCGPKVDLADVFASNGVKMVSVDMPPFMQIHAVDVTRKARDSLEKFSSKSLAFTLKKEFDGAYGPAWHCIVGTSFGSFVTHSVGGFMYFSMDHKMYVLLFKTTVQRAD